MRTLLLMALLAGTPDAGTPKRSFAVCYPMRDRADGKVVIDMTHPLPCCWEPELPPGAECAIHRPG